MGNRGPERQSPKLARSRVMSRMKLTDLVVAPVAQAVGQQFCGALVELVEPGPAGGREPEDAGAFVRRVGGPVVS